MELRHLRYFQILAMELHFGRAAKRLNIDQSPLSRAIKELEEDLGVRLLVRDAKRTLLTKEGEIILDKIRRAITSVEDIRQSAHAAQKGCNEHLRIAITDYIDIYFFSEFLRLCRQQKPQTNISVYEVSFHEQLSGLFHNEYDIGLGLSAPPLNQEGLVVETVFNDPMLVLLPLRHPLLNCSQLTIDDIAQYTLIAPDQGVFPGLYNQICGMFELHGHTPKVSTFVKSYSTLLALVSSGFGLGFVGKQQFENKKNSNIAFRVLSEQPQVNTYLLYPQTFQVCSIKKIISKIENPSILELN